MKYEQLYNILPFSFILASILLGIFLEKLIIKKLNYKKTTANEILKPLKGYISAILILLGTYLTLRFYLSESHIYSVGKVLSTILILIFTIISMKLVIGFIRYKTMQLGSAIPASSILENIIKIIILISGFMVMLNNLNISITPILTALGVGGLAVALALQPTLSNLFSGIQIIASKELNIGDYIKIETGEEGYVEDITWRHTAIKTLANNTFIIPNTKVVNSIFTNYYKPTKDMGILIPVGVSYDSNLEFVEKTTIEVAIDITNKLFGKVDSTPLIRYNQFDSSSINFNVVLRINEFTDQSLLKHEFIKALHERYKKEGINIPFPITTVHLKKE